MDLVTDDIEYWDPTLAAPVTNIQDYAVRLDRFFTAISDARWTQRAPVIIEEFDDGTARASESWAFSGVNTGDLWTGDRATGRVVETIGVDVYEFRDGLVCKQYSYFDVLESLRQFGIEPKGSVRRETVHATFGPSRDDKPASAADMVASVTGQARRAFARIPLLGS